MPPGEETGDETYDDNDQVLFVVEGRGEAILNGHAEPTADHDAIFVSARTRRNLRNPGVADLKIFAVCYPPLDSGANIGARGHGIKELLCHRSIRTCHQF